MVPRENTSDKRFTPYNSGTIPSKALTSMDYLTLTESNPSVRAQNAGLFVSRAVGMHPCRTLPSYELIFVTGGTLHMREGEQRFDLRFGQSLLLWPGREHAGDAPYAPDCSFYWLHFEVKEEHSNSTAAVAAVPQTATVTRPDRLTELFRRFLDDQEAGELEPGAANCLLLLMLYEVVRKPARTAAEAAGSSGGTAPPAVPLARHAQQYLLTHLQEPLSTGRIARALDAHPDYLGRAYRLVYGCTLTEGLHRQRLKRARSLLLDSNETVEVIARECGFTSALFFRRIFKRYEGVSPSIYRRLYARVHLNSA